jgi:hypothetical protein
MVASVSELIQAGLAKYQRPKSQIGELSDIINGGLDTYASTKDQYLDIHRKIIEQKMLQEKQLKDQQDAQRKAQEQAAIKERFKAAQGQPTASNPADRLAQAGRNEEFKVNEAGDWSMESKAPTAKDVSLDDYLEEAVRSGKMSLQDAYKLKNTSGGGVSNDLLYRMDKDRQEAAQKATDYQGAVAIPGFKTSGQVKVRPEDAAKLRDSVSEMKDLVSGIDRMKELIAVHGPTQKFGQDSGEMRSLASNLKLKIKNTAALGQISATDLALIEGQIVDPSSINFTTKENALKQLDTAKQRAQDALRAKLETSGYASEAPPQTAPPPSGITHRWNPATGKVEAVK